MQGPEFQINLKKVSFSNNLNFLMQMHLNFSLFCLWFSIIPFFLFIYLVFIFDSNFYSYQFLFSAKDFIPAFFIRNDIYNINYLIEFLSSPFGFDGISIMLSLLTAFIFPICFYLLSTNFSFKTRVVLMFLLTVLEIFLFLVFCSLDLFIFYVFFEGTLIPMFIIIGFGGTRFRKIKASYYLFFYTFAGSIFMFMALLSIFYSIGNTLFEDVFIYNFNHFHQKFL